MIRTLIVDDEPLSRDELKYQLSKHPKIQVIAESFSLSTAMMFVERHQPDLVFLDIHMEEENTGLKIAENLSKKHNAPLIIFTSAHPQHALDAYDFNPLHYLLKPIAETKLANALHRAEEIIEARNEEKNASSANPGAGNNAAQKKLSIKYRQVNDNGEVIRPTVYLEPDEIMYIHKDKMGNTVEVLATEDRCFEGVRQTLQNFEDALDQYNFFRVHTSFLVNLNFVEGQKQRSKSNENYLLQLKGNDKEIPISKLKYPALKQRLSTPTLPKTSSLSKA